MNGGVGGKRWKDEGLTEREEESICRVDERKVGSREGGKKYFNMEE